MIKKKVLTREQIIKLLISHYRDRNKLLTRSQINELSKYKNDYEFLQPDYSKYVYSGIINISDKKLKDLKSQKYSNRMIWSSDVKTGLGFYSFKQHAIEGYNKVLIIGYFSDDFILNPLKISKLKEIRKERFSKTMALSFLVKAEEEILTGKPVKIHSILHDKIKL